MAPAFYFGNPAAWEEYEQLEEVYPQLYRALEEAFLPNLRARPEVVTGNPSLMRQFEEASAKWPTLGKEFVERGIVVSSVVGAAGGQQALPALDSLDLVTPASQGIGSSATGGGAPEGFDLESLVEEAESSAVGKLATALTAGGDACVPYQLQKTLSLRLVNDVLKAQLLAAPGIPKSMPFPGSVVPRYVHFVSPPLLAPESSTSLRVFVQFVVEVFGRRHGPVGQAAIGSLLCLYSRTVQVEAEEINPPLGRTGPSGLDYVRARIAVPPDVSGEAAPVWMLQESEVPATALNQTERLLLDQVVLEVGRVAVGALHGQPIGLDSAPGNPPLTLLQVQSGAVGVSSGGLFSHGGSVSLGVDYAGASPTGVSLDCWILQNEDWLVAVRGDFLQVLIDAATGASLFTATCVCSNGQIEVAVEVAGLVKDTKRFVPLVEGGRIRLDDLDPDPPGDGLVEVELFWGHKVKLRLGGAPGSGVRREAWAILRTGMEDALNGLLASAAAQATAGGVGIVLDDCRVCPGRIALAGTASVVMGGGEWPWPKGSLRPRILSCVHSQKSKNVKLLTCDQSVSLSDPELFELAYAMYVAPFEPWPGAFRAGMLKVTPSDLETYGGTWSATLRSEFSLGGVTLKVRAWVLKYSGGARFSCSFDSADTHLGGVEGQVGGLVPPVAVVKEIEPLPQEAAQIELCVGARVVEATVSLPYPSEMSIHVHGEEDPVRSVAYRLNVAEQVFGIAGALELTWMDTTGATVEIPFRVDTVETIRPERKDDLEWELKKRREALLLEQWKHAGGHGGGR
ncbi:MAG: hypothetical protein FJ087_05085 [Deltaproteobacteria bacterium]|nr:hypothetical protein [Deltaproteobacteria bacterium]